MTEKVLREARARVFEYIATAIEDDAEWFIDNSIDDADITDGLLIAAKALRSGKVKLEVPTNGNASVRKKSR